MPKSMTVKQLRQNVKALNKIYADVSDTMSSAQYVAANYGLYGDLSVAAAMLDGAIRALAFQLERIVDDEGRAADTIVDFP